MNITCISSLSIKAAPRKFTPLSEHNGPILELMFYEQEEINILNKQLSELQNLVDDINTTLSINKHLTGFQKNKCKKTIMSIMRKITTINEKIRNIKVTRYAKQKEEYLKLKKII